MVSIGAAVRHPKQKHLACPRAATFGGMASWSPAFFQGSGGWGSGKESTGLHGCATQSAEIPTQAHESAQSCVSLFTLGLPWDRATSTSI